MTDFDDGEHSFGHRSGVSESPIDRDLNLTLLLYCTQLNSNLPSSDQQRGSNPFLFTYDILIIRNWPPRNLKGLSNMNGSVLNHELSQASALPP